MDSNTPKVLAEASPGLIGHLTAYEAHFDVKTALEDELFVLRRRHLPALQAMYNDDAVAGIALQDLDEFRRVNRALAQRDCRSIEALEKFFEEPCQSIADILLKYAQAETWLWRDEAKEYADEMTAMLRSMWDFLREQASVPAMVDPPSDAATAVPSLTRAIAEHGERLAPHEGASLVGETGVRVNQDAFGHSSLTQTIATFRQAWEQTMANELHSVVINRNEVQPWWAPLEALKSWASPASNMTDVLEALRLIRDEAKDYDETPLIFSLVSAVLGYLEEQLPTSATEAPERHAKAADLVSVHEAVREAQAMVLLAHQAIRQVQLPHASRFGEAHQKVSDITSATEAAARSLDTALSRIGIDPLEEVERRCAP